MKKFKNLTEKEKQELLEGVRRTSEKYLFGSRHPEAKKPKKKKEKAR